MYWTRSLKRLKSAKTVKDLKRVVSEMTEEIKAMEEVMLPKFMGEELDPRILEESLCATSELLTKAIAERLEEHVDTNHDGVLSAEEWNAVDWSEVPLPAFSAQLVMGELLNKEKYPAYFAAVQQNQNLGSTNAPEGMVPSGAPRQSWSLLIFLVPVMLALFLNFDIAGLIFISS